MSKRTEPQNGLGHKRVTKPGQPVFWPCFMNGQQVGYVTLIGKSRYNCYDNHGRHFGTRFQIVDARELIIHNIVKNNYESRKCISQY